MLQLHCRLLDQQLWRCRNLHNRTAFSIVLLWRITQHLVVQARDASVKRLGYKNLSVSEILISRFLCGISSRSSMTTQTL